MVTARDILAHLLKEHDEKMIFSKPKYTQNSTCVGFDTNITKQTHPPIPITYLVSAGLLLHKFWPDFEKYDRQQSN